MKLVSKDDDIDRLDDFFFTKLDIGKKYPDIQNSTKLLLSFPLLVKDKLILREDFPKIKLYCKETSRRFPFLEDE